MKPKGQQIIGLAGIIIGFLGFCVGMAAAFQASPWVASVVFVLGTMAFGSFIYFPIRKRMREKKLMESGTRAKGMIVELWDTGVTINNSPQIGLMIEVTPPSGAPFRSKLKLLVSRLEVGRYQVGMECNVIYDPQDTSKIMIDNSGSRGNLYTEQTFNQGISPFEAQQILSDNDKEVKRILSIGIECNAVITSFELMGILVNGNNPAVRLGLEVLPDYEPAYSASCMGVIMESSVAKFQPGKKVKVKYDPRDKSKVSVSHS